MGVTGADELEAVCRQWLLQGSPMEQIHVLKDPIDDHANVDVHVSIEV